MNTTPTAPTWADHSEPYEDDRQVHTRTVRVRPGLAVELRQADGADPEIVLGGVDVYSVDAAADLAAAVTLLARLAAR